MRYSRRANFSSCDSLSIMMHRPTRGFTLLEMIVSVGIFAVVMVVVTGAYLTLISLDRRARATNQVVSSLYYAVDTMARGIRTGTNYKCVHTTGAAPDYGNSTDGFCDAISYTDTSLPSTGDQTVIYKYKASNGTIGRCESISTYGACFDSVASSLTDPAITINTLTFYVRGVSTSTAAYADQQPQILFTIKGTMVADSKGGTVPFIIQSGATQRVIDL